MGFIRLLLALSVALSHTPFGSMLAGGQEAVQTFYIISGFYIALVLHTVPAYSNPRNFYANRMLRLFPQYAAVALLTGIAFAIVRDNYYRDLSGFAGISFWGQLFLCLANLVIFFQDWIMFLGVRDGAMVFAGSDFGLSVPPLYHFLLLPQAWTLGVEMSFYLIAPFALRLRTVTLIVIVLVSIGVRVVAASIWGADKDPWTYRFFPFELALFLSGSISYRLLRFLERKESLRWSTCAVAFLILSIATATFRMTGIDIVLRDVLFYMLVAIALPFAFRFSCSSWIDRFLGDLSYPFYICHYLTLTVVLYICIRFGIDNRGGITPPLLGIAAGLVLSLVLHLLVQHPVERFRATIARRPPAPGNRTDQNSLSIGGTEPLSEERVTHRP
jgi:peptidoglycan/LPS O-acetylase OafA/YrhL